MGVVQCRNHIYCFVVRYGGIGVYRTSGVRGLTAFCAKIMPIIVRRPKACSSYRTSHVSYSKHVSFIGNSNTGQMSGIQVQDIKDMYCIPGMFHLPDTSMPDKLSTFRLGLQCRPVPTPDMP